MTQSVTSLPVKCQQCNEELTTPIVCTGCHALYPTSMSTDYFTLLGLERQYDIHEDQLNKAYRSLLRNIHPDRYTNATDTMRSLAVNLSASINHAYGVLKDPVLRASYLLESSGGPSAADVREVPGELLSEVMMLREEIDDAKDQSDSATLDQLTTSIQTKRTETLQSIAERADHLFEAKGDDKKEFRKLLNSVKYYDNLLAEIGSDPFEKSTGKPHA